MKTVIFRAGCARLITLCLAHLPGANHSLPPDTSSRCLRSVLQALLPAEAKPLCFHCLTCQLGLPSNVGGGAVSPHFDPLPQHTCKEPHSSSHSDAQALLSEGTLIMLVWILQRNRTNRRKKYIYYIDREIDYIDYYMDYNMCVYTHI